MNEKYEAIFIIKNYDDIKKVENTIEKINLIINENECEIIKNEKMGIRRLAYEIKGEKRGYYYLINFKVSGEKNNHVNKIKIGINTLEEVIKYIVIPIDEE